MSDSLAHLTPMRSVTELRSVVESFAARYAALRVAAGAETKKLLHAFSQMQRAAAADEEDMFIRADWNLHLAVVRLAEVEGLEATWNAVAGKQRAFHDESIGRCWPDLNVLFEAHRALVDTICEGNPTAAEEASESHLNAIWYRLADLTDDPSLPGEPLERVRTYMLFHLNELLRLDFLARYVARTSPGHLARLFRQAYGTSFTEYLREMRMRKAMELLVTTDQPIGRIARRVGYQDGSRFAKHFAARFGLSPRAYRKQIGSSDVFDWLA